ncbi:MAG TPA: ABC transporter permease [Actinocrinis sp.]|uniref:ABC transporter permease n=1 Tax=Actinocrinis sp. TaxID=1920516 RepID=UPI002DDD6029|nr:ABC transporter permease [Actinocrinis sp.]HEV2347236.1 ABC transporter permease [Actinocrinis sp.]
MSASAMGVSSASESSDQKISGQTHSFTGTRVLIRLASRRDRIMLPVWVYVLIAASASTAYSFKGLYPTESSREQFAATINATPSTIAIYGAVHATSLGGITAWRIAVLAATLAGIMSVLMVVRHTRAEEQTGRQELVGATSVGHRAPLAAALGIALVANLGVALGTAVVLPFLGCGFVGGLALGLAIGTCGIFFTGLAAVTAQIAETSRAANGLASAALGVFYLARAAADASGYGWLMWCTPLGWVERVDAYGADRWWVLALPLACALAFATVATRLAATRDLGAGLLASRPGAARAGRDLRGAYGLSWRLHRGAVLGWSIGFLLGGAVTGYIAKDIVGVITSSAQMERIITEMGGQSGLVDAYLAAIMGIAGLIAAIYAVQAVLRARSEETAGRAEPLLAGALGRVRWASGHLAAALIGSAILLTATGLGAGLAHGLRMHDVSGQLPRVLGAALAQWPAVAVVAAIAAALFGAAPRYAAGVAWGAVAVFLLLGQLGPVLKLGQAVMDVSPFSHVPKVPGGVFSWTPLGWLTLLGAALLVLGLAAFRRRDLQSE